MKKYLLATCLIILSFSLLAQESIIKKFANPRRSDAWMNPICLYPSTLRMINLTQDSNFNELVNDIEKISIYTLDSATIASKSYKSLITDYEAKGFEEYLTMLGQQNVRIVGKKKEYIGVVATEDKVIAFYLRGDIAFENIPLLLKNFQSSDILPLLTDQFDFK